MTVVAPIYPNDRSRTSMIFARRIVSAADHCSRSHGAIMAVQRSSFSTVRESFLPMKRLSRPRLHIGNTNSNGHRPDAGCSFPLHESATMPRGGACRKLKKTPRALESEFSCGTNIINHQFWVSPVEQHPGRILTYTHDCSLAGLSGRQNGERKKLRAGEKGRHDGEKRGKGENRWAEGSGVWEGHEQPERRNIFRRLNGQRKYDGRNTGILLKRAWKIFTCCKCRHCDEIRGRG